MTNKNLTIGIILAIVVAFGGYFFPQVGKNFGAITDTSYFDYFNAATGGGFQINGVTVHSASVLKTTTAGGTLNVTTSDTATSTSILGCVQTTATSTQTAIRLLYNTQATTSISGTAAGTVVWGYGTCPF